MENKIKIVMIAGLLSLSCALTAQTSPAPAPQKTGTAAGASTPGIQGGSILYAELARTLDAKKVKVGDTVTALLLADIISHGKIVAHRDSKLIGHVTEAQARSKETPESRLGVVFEKVILKGGQELPFHSILTALHPPDRPALEPPPSGPTPPINTVTAVSKRYSTSNTIAPARQTTPSMSPSANKEMDSNSQALAVGAPTDIEGLSLATAGGTQAVVSLNRTVKLESGIVIELRITDANGK
jgi:hypothetical protein